MMRRFWRDERAVTMVEYGLIVALIALTVIVGFGNASDALTFLWSNNNSRLVQAINANQ